MTDIETIIESIINRPKVELPAALIEFLEQCTDTDIKGGGEMTYEGFCGFLRRSFGGGN